MQPIHATFQQGVFRPVNPVELPEGCEVELQIVNQRERIQQAEATHSARKSIEEEIDELVAQVPPEAWNELPADLCTNLDHYLYGTPKQ